MNDKRHDKALANRLYESQPTNEASESSESKPMRLRELSRAEQRGAMLWLWKHMLAIFGTAWTREYGEADGATSEIWADSLGGLTGEQLKRGVDASKEWGEKFPPNMAQFTRLCLTTNENTAEVKAYLEAPEKKHNPEGLRQLLEVWEAVKKQPNEWDTFENKQAAYNFLGLQTRWGPLKRT